MENHIDDPAGGNAVTIDRSRYTYTIRPFEVINSLGFVRAVLQEYLITGADGQQYKLYRTTEGNWYDVERANPAAGKTILLQLKMELDEMERRQA